MEIHCKAGQATDNNTIRCMLIAYCLTKATNTHSDYVRPIVYARQQWLHENVPMLRLYVYWLSCYASQTIRKGPGRQKLCDSPLSVRALLLLGTS